MRKPFQSVAVAMVAAIVASAFILSNARVAVGQPRARSGGGGATANGPYFVVQIINPPEDVTARGGQTTQPDPYDVVDAKQLKDKQKELEDKYKTNYEKWQDEKKIDPKAPRPMKPSIKRLKTFKTKEVADEYKQKLEDELAKKEADKTK